MSRDIASEFNKRDEDNDDNELSHQYFRSLVKRKHDAEEIKEIKAKTEARRRKAYENYEESCKVKGKFLARSCIPLHECFSKNKLKFIPLTNSSSSALAQLLTTTKTTTTTKSKNGKFILILNFSKL